MQKTDELYAKAAQKFEIGDYEGAKKLANECLKLDNKEFRALNMLGVLLANEGKDEAAINAYEKSLESNPKNPQTINNLANLLSKSGELQKAASLYQNAIVLDPSFLVARNNFAKTALKLGRYDEAISESARSFEMDSTDGSPLITLGNALRQKKDYPAAEEAYKIALNYSGEVHKGALIELGILKNEQKLFDEAIGYFVAVLQIDPNHSGSYCNISSILIDKGEIQKAKGAIIKAFELDPNDATNHINLGVLLKWEGRYEEAKNSFAKAIELGDPKNAAKTNLGLILLAEGEYKDGFALYDYRPKKTLECNAPLYDGSECNNKSIFVYHEQGFGDTINFARLLTHPKLQKANIIFLPQAQLYSVFKNSSLNIRTIGDSELQDITFDTHTSLVDLLKMLEITKDEIPQNINYINANKERTEFFVSKIKSDKKKVGIVWSGNKNYLGDVLRSIDYKLFATLKNDKVSFVSLQKEYEQVEMEYLKEHLGVLDFADELNDFADTAALIAALDMVLTVDTSVAHLAATMNKPTWVLLPSAPDWRWGLEGDKTPWYESARLFRKAQDEDWTAVIERVKTNLLQ